LPGRDALHRIAKASSQDRRAATAHVPRCLAPGELYPFDRSHEFAVI
jgi:hypothetical protein